MQNFFLRPSSRDLIMYWYKFYHELFLNKIRWTIWYGPYEMGHMIWFIWNGPYDMVHMKWDIWYGSYEMGNMIWFIWNGPYDMAIDRTWLSNPFLDDIKLIFILLKSFTIYFFRTLQYSAEFQINIYYEFQNMFYEVKVNNQTWTSWVLTIWFEIGQAFCYIFWNSFKSFLMCSFSLS